MNTRKGGLGLGSPDIPVNAADYDCDVCHHNGPDKPLHLLVLISMGDTKLRVRIGDASFARHPIPPDVYQHQETANDHVDNLERDTRDKEIVPKVRLFGVRVLAYGP